MSDRRKHPRVKRRVQVEYGEDDLGERAFARDISVGGLFLECRRLPDLGTRLHLHILEPHRDFYAEGIVVRQRKVDVRMRSIEKEGVGIRFITPSELVAEAIPKAARTRDTTAVVCADAEAVRTLLREQVYSRVLLVPVRNPAPAQGTVVEFAIEVQLNGGTTVEGQGRVVQVIGTGGTDQKAVLEIQDAARIRAELEGAVG